MTKAPTPTEKSKKQRDNIKNATKNFDNQTIADRLRTVSWSNSSHHTGVVKPVYERFILNINFLFSVFRYMALIKISTIAIELG